MKLENKSVFVQKLSKIPVGLTGVAVGMGGLGNAWSILMSEVLKDWGVGDKANALWTHSIQIFCFIFTILFCLTIITRQITNRTIFRKEWKDPMISSFLPTIAMSLMLIGGFVAQIPTFSGGAPSVNAGTIIGAIIWYTAILLHITFMILFFVHIIGKHDFKNHDVYASWFVPPIGIIVSCTVAGSFPSEIIPQWLFQAIWIFGFTMYVIALPYVLYKIIFADNIHHERIPTLAIFGAPANLSLAGFLSVKDFAKWGDAYWVLIILLTILAIATTLFLYVCFIRIFTTKFNGTYASLTFPTAIGSVAMLKLSSAIQDEGTNLHGNLLLGETFNVIAYIEISVATIIIFYVLIRYLIMIAKIFKNKLN